MNFFVGAFLHAGGHPIRTINNSGTPQTKLLSIAVALLGPWHLRLWRSIEGKRSTPRGWLSPLVCIYLIAYRFYGLFIANRGVSGSMARGRRLLLVIMTVSITFPLINPCFYGHHFAAIAGAGPLVGPVLAAQMGYLPGTL